MKDARSYERKFKKVLPQQVPAAKGKPEAAAEESPVRVLIESILQADTTDKRAAAAMTVIEEEFVDYNELRAAPVKDIADCVGRDMPNVRAKAESLITVLNGIFSRQSELALDSLHKLTKKDLRRHLSELGMEPYAAARLTMLCFNGHAVPVDQSLVEVLQMNDLAAPGSTIEDVQKFLERIVPQKNGLTVHRFLRSFVDKHAKALEKKHQEEAEARARAEAQARAKAEAEAKAKAAAEEARQAKADEKAARAKAKAAEKAAKAKAARKTARRAGGKERKKK
jgi:endonuclease III